MNPVGELLGLDEIHLDVDVPDKARLLQRIASFLAGRLGLSDAEVLESLIAREELGSTGLGHGVAIPHARMPQCYAVAGVFVQTTIAIPFNAPDHKPVSLFLALVVPKQATERHLKLLATAATMFNDRGFREKLRAGSDPAAVRELFMAWPDSPATHSDGIDATPEGSAGNNSGG
jgi:PTS system nitrogen regulatory IIA component